MTYWSNLFTGTTWEEFLKAGGKISGWRPNKARRLEKVKPGDHFVCYVTGVHRWVGLLKVLGPSTDKTQIWSIDDYPVRMRVEPLITLTPETGVPLEQLEGKVTFYPDASARGRYDGFFRGAPRALEDADAQAIVAMLQQAESHPVRRPVDARKLQRIPAYLVNRGESAAPPVAVTIPGREEELVAPLPRLPASEPEEAAESLHTEMQHHLLTVGADMGLEVWVARNDRSRTWKGKRLVDLPGVIQKLPGHFNEATTGTIELIDVLWLKGKTIVAAFEVEHTTSIYSGLLRMSDLVALQPNLNIDLYIVAPEERRDRVASQIRRPTFALGPQPLPEICGFISFERFRDTVEGARRHKLLRSLTPAFLDEVAEFFDNEE